MRRQATPLLVSTDRERSIAALTPTDFYHKGAGKYDEAFIQRLIQDCPSVLPIASIEPKFWPAVSVSTELPRPSGSLDNLLVTPLGDLIAVECKLWRNPESQRKVVAQAIDYAKDLQSMEYEGLQDAIRRSRRDATFDLFRDASMTSDEPEGALDEARFVDAVSRNLRRGRCLLVIVGDGITENVERMSDFLQQHAGLHFALALVELAIFELPGTAQHLVVPSIPMRTRVIDRGIVQIEDARIVVAPPNRVMQTARAGTLTEKDFYAELDRSRPGTSQQLLAFLERCEDLQISFEIQKSLLVRMTIENFKITPFSVDSIGRVETS